LERLERTEEGHALLGSITSSGLAARCSVSPEMPPGSHRVSCPSRSSGCASAGAAASVRRRGWLAAVV